MKGLSATAGIPAFSIMEKEEDGCGATTDADMAEVGLLSDQSEDNDGECDFDGFVTVGPGGKRRIVSPQKQRPTKLNRLGPETLQMDIGHSITSRTNSRSPTRFNHTLDFNNRHSLTFIIKPIEHDAKLSGNPIKIAQAFKSEPFSLLDCKTLRINPRRNIIAVEVNSITSDLEQTILQTTKFGEFKVSIYHPKAGTQTMGVIGPIDQSVDTGELLSMLDMPPNHKAINIVRLPKFTEGTKSESAVVRITFEGQELPSSVYIGMLKFNVKPYSHPPCRCYNCQRFGHLASGCNAKKKCLVCAGDHSVSECPGTNPTKCANCSGNHKASYHLCPTWLKFKKKTDPQTGNTAPEVQPSKDTNNNHRNISSLNTITVEAEVHNTQGSYTETTYASKARGAASVTAQAAQPADSSVLLEAIKESQKNIIREINQTFDEKLGEIKSSLSREIDRKIKESNIKIVKLLQEVLATKFDAQKKATEIDPVIRNLYGEDMWGSLIAQINPIQKENDKPTTVKPTAPTGKPAGGKKDRFTFKKINPS